MASKIKVDQIQTGDGTGTIALQNQLSGLTSASMPTGSVLQVVSATKTDTQVISSSSFVDITGLSATITPSSSSNKIYVSVNVSFSGVANAYIAFQILRGTTEILKNTESGTGIECAGGSVINSSGNIPYSVLKESMSGLDSPSTTSATTYKVQISPKRTGTETATVNRSYSLGDDNQYRTVSTITLMEIAG